MRRTSHTIVLFVLAAVACRFDSAYRDDPNAATTAVVKGCTPNQLFCKSGGLARCNDDGLTDVAVDDCTGKGEVCAPTLLACTPCVPGALTCNGQTVLGCSADGQTTSPQKTCDADQGIACRAGDCIDLCGEAAEQRSNVGCEYWGADLDNAVVSPSLNAAQQQFAIVVSNVEAEIPAKVIVDQDDAAPGEAARIRVMANAVVAPRNLEVFRLGPREVDGSPDGEFNTGTGTALTRHAYRVRSNVPIVAYQFNPLENVNVFSNDASMLLPVAALGDVAGRAYVIASWPQTIANSEIASQNFGTDLRAFLAFVAVRPDTHVHLKTKARIIPGGPLPNGLPADGEADFTLQPFEVLNLETGEFRGDFTGSLVDADEPVVVFPGSEASDAPFYDDLANRFCCADHLEQQGTPLRSVGKSYALARMPNRTRAVIAAGASLGPIDEPEYYRIVAARPGVTHVTTSLPAPDDAFDLTGEGADRTLVAHQDFVLSGSLPIIVADVQASQEAAGVPRGLPGGDPSLVFVPPVEQWRTDYALLTPDKYSFDFLVISAPASAQVFIDRQPVGSAICETAAIPAPKGPAPYVAYRCQLSYPVIDPAHPTPVLPGRQNDGVHLVQADVPVGVIVYGFDAFVSYAYAAGTELKQLTVQ